MKFDNNTQAYVDNTNNNSKKGQKQKVRLERIAKKCAQRFLSEMKEIARADGREACLEGALSQFEGATPTVNQMCDLARDHNLLMLLRLENERESVDILVDPQYQTVSQMGKNIREWSSQLDPIERGQDWEDEDNDPEYDEDEEEQDDENPIPGHEDDNDDEGDDDNGGRGRDDEEEDDDDDDDEDDDDDDDDDGDDNDDDDDDNDGDDDDDYEDENELGNDDNAWALRRFIAVVDRADLVFRISPVRKTVEQSRQIASIAIVVTSPPRSVHQLLRGYKWWTDLRKNR